MSAAPVDVAAIERAAALVADADAVVIAAGAGMGVDSGRPDFRGNVGFWKAYPALAAEGTSFMDLASPEAFLADPRRTWGFYGHRLDLYRRSLPHEGYRLLRHRGEEKRHGYFVFTSNVDGHFQKAGFDPLRIDECHGSIHRLQCLLPCSPLLWPASDLQPAVDEARCELCGPLPPARTAAPSHGRTFSCSTIAAGSRNRARGRRRAAGAGWNRHAVR